MCVVVAVGFSVYWSFKNGLCEVAVQLLYLRVSSTLWLTCSRFAAVRAGYLTHVECAVKMVAISHVARAC